MLKLSSYFLYAMALLSIVGGLYLTSSSLQPAIPIVGTLITVILFAIGGLVVQSIANMKLHIEQMKPNIEQTTRYLMAISKRRKNC